MISAEMAVRSVKLDLCEGGNKRPNDREIAMMLEIDRLNDVAEQLIQERDNLLVACGLSDRKTEE